MSSFSTLTYLLLLLTHQLTCDHEIIREYYFDTTTRTWNESKIFCDTYYDGLATILTKNDLNSAAFTIPIMVGHLITRVWIGLNDINNESNWEWSDKTKCLYNETNGGHDCSDFWWTHEPNNAQGDVGGEENCGHMWFKQGAWYFNDVSCDNQLPTLCNKPFEYTYIFNGTFMNWTTAVNYCNKYHGGIATIQTSDDYINAIKTIPTAVEYAWIGLNNLRNSTTWEWSSGDICINNNISHDCSVYWLPGEPTNLAKGDNCGELSYFRSTKTWLMDAYFCDWTQGVLCTESAVTAHPTSQPTADAENANFALSLTLRDWGDALIYCEMNYYSLATIKNDYEIQQIVSLIPTKPTNDHILNFRSAWIGLNDIKTEGIWEWIDESECILNNNNCTNKWAPGEPNDYNIGEDCGEIRIFSDNSWNINDNDCDSPMFVLCSKNETTLTPTLTPTNIPTKLPTKMPTQTPSKLPISITTQIPTIIPTITPNNNSNTKSSDHSSSVSASAVLNIILTIIIIILLIALFTTLYCLIKFKKMYKRIEEMSGYIGSDIDGHKHVNTMSIDDNNNDMDIQFVSGGDQEPTTN